MKNWTVAYRLREPNPEPVIHRVDLDVTWQEAFDLAGEFTRALGPTYEVWYVSTRRAELNGYVQVEDVLNVLMPDDVRVPIADDGLQLNELVHTL